MGRTATRLVVVSVLIAVALSVQGGGCTKGKGGPEGKKVIVLGFDGLDPSVLERMAAEGKVPHFRNLMDKGYYRRLETSIPPQSPVAWSNFITGMNPGGHGIFDFIHRDEKTLVPYLSTSEVRPADRKITMGGWIVPLERDKLVMLRKGLSFWEILEEKRIPATVIRVPANFPPVGNKTESLSGMGTPDIQGTYGMHTFYTTDRSMKEKDVSGGKIVVVRRTGDRIETAIDGPKNTFRKNAPPCTVPLTVDADPRHPVARITVQGRQWILRQGEWSPWIRLSFEIIPHAKKISGICRFYLKEVHPEFRLYASPVNIDPADPAMPISTPERFVKDLQDEVGPFYTQGIPEDTKALINGIFDDNEFLAQANIVAGETRRLFAEEMNRFRSGLLFFYFGSTDQIPHMFWRSMDPRHPAHDPSDRFGGVIEDTYRKMDDILGSVLARIDGNTTLIILSDHGFAPYYRSFNLNTWLLKEGYIVLKGSKKGEEFLGNVDWSKTRAYGLGFNSLYLNVRGRERNGIVRPGAESESLAREISDKLTSLTDPVTKKRIVTKVYRSATVYTGEYAGKAPELIVGYNSGYRASWETVLGGFPDDLLADNRGKWSGDHLIDHTLVPGVLLSNRKIRSENPALYDLAPTILGEFGIAKKKWMVGSSIF